MTTTGPVRFEIVDGLINRFDSLTERVLSQWRPVGTQVVQILELDGRLIVREDYYLFPREQSNLYCIDSEFRFVWFAERATPTDAYANPVSEQNGVLECGSWEGYSVTLDPRNGKAVNILFTK